MLNGGIPLFPQATDFKRIDFKTCSNIVTTVVFPFVPVIEIIGVLEYSLNISMSVLIDIFLFLISLKITFDLSKPGLIITCSTLSK